MNGGEKGKKKIEFLFFFFFKCPPPHHVPQFVSQDVYGTSPFD